jgi:hypothetical protein
MEERTIVLMFHHRLPCLSILSYSGNCHPLKDTLPIRTSNQSDSYTQISLYAGGRSVALYMRVAEAPSTRDVEHAVESWADDDKPGGLACRVRSCGSMKYVRSSQVPRPDVASPPPQGFAGLGNTI